MKHQHTQSTRACIMSRMRMHPRTHTRPQQVCKLADRHACPRHGHEGASVCARVVHTHTHTYTHTHTHGRQVAAPTCLHAGDVLVKQHYVRGIPLNTPSSAPRSVARRVPRGQRPMATCCPAQGRGCTIRTRFAIRFSVEARGLDGGGKGRKRHLGAQGRRVVRW